MRYIANLSCGKDSLAMVLRLMEERKPLTDVVFYDTGMEFNAIYNLLEQITPKLQDYGVKVKVIKPEMDFLTQMLLVPKCAGTCKESYGYDWCGGTCRWQTASKVTAINKYLNSLGEYQQYIGIAYDEPKRVKYEHNKVYPLVEWQMTEKDCLNYCHDRGYYWLENGIELYSILDRVSCWCCKNKNLKELRNIYHYLPYYWGLLKGMQSRIDRPFRSDGKTIFDLEERFKNEDAQMSMF